MEEFVVARIFILGLIQAILDDEITEKTILEVELPNVSNKSKQILELVQSIETVQSASFTGKRSSSTKEIFVNLGAAISFVLEISPYYVRVTPGE